MRKNKELVIVGTGETALLAYEYFTHDSEYSVVAFAVGREFLSEEILYNLPVITLEELEDKFPSSSVSLFVAISSGKLNRNRTHVYLNLKSQGYEFASYVSSKAFVWHNVKIGENCFILESNTLQSFVEVGDNVTLWSGNHIGHRSIVGDHCFISSHCVISGFCKIENSCFLGVNCTLEDHVKVASDNFIGAGALIQKTTEEKRYFQEKKTELSKINTHRLFRIKEQ